MDLVLVLLLPAVFFSLVGLIVREAFQHEKRQHQKMSHASPQSLQHSM